MRLPSNVEGNIGNDQLEDVTYHPGLRRSARRSNTPDRYSPGETGMLALMNRLGNERPDVPADYHEAIISRNSLEWKNAMVEEIQQLHKETWELVPHETGAKTVKSKCVFSLKTDAMENVTRFRARLVAKGYLQRAGIDYDEFFAPVAKYSTVRFMLALAALSDFKIIQIDVNAAFFNGNLDEHLFME